MDFFIYEKLQTSSHLQVSVILKIVHKLLLSHIFLDSLKICLYFASLINLLSFLIDDMVFFKNHNLYGGHAARWEWPVNDD